MQSRSRTWKRRCPNAWRNGVRSKRRTARRPDGRSISTTFSPATKWPSPIFGSWPWPNSGNCKNKPSQSQNNRQWTRAANLLRLPTNRLPRTTTLTTPRIPTASPSSFEFYFTKITFLSVSNITGVCWVSRRISRPPRWDLSAPAVSIFGPRLVPAVFACQTRPHSARPSSSRGRADRRCSPFFCTCPRRSDWTPSRINHKNELSSWTKNKNGPINQSINPSINPYYVRNWLWLWLINYFSLKKDTKRSKFYTPIRSFLESRHDVWRDPTAPVEHVHAERRDVTVPVVPVAFHFAHYWR